MHLLNCFSTTTNLMIDHTAIKVFRQLHIKRFWWQMGRNSKAFQEEGKSRLDLNEG